METLLRAGLSNAAAATALALLVTCLARPLARRPAVIHGLWLLVLLKLITPPIYEVPIPWPMSDSRAEWTCQALAGIGLEADLLSGARDGIDPADLAHSHPSDLAVGELVVIGEDQIDTGPVTQVSTMRASESSFDWRRWTVMAWAAGTIAVLFVTGRRIGRFQRLLRTATPASDEEREWLAVLAAEMNVRRVPDLFWIRARVSPLVWSLGWRPRLILPHDLWKTLDDRQRSTLVAHELAHLKRGDHLVRFLELLVTALYWWHPLLWWIRQSLRDAEEQCCDAWVVWMFPAAAKSYAETLLDAIDFIHRTPKAEPLLASGLGKVPHLRRRLTMIMTGTTFRVLGVRGTLALLVLAGAMLPVGATWAQQGPEPMNLDIKVRNDGGDEPLQVELLGQPGEQQPHVVLYPDQLRVVESGALDQPVNDMVVFRAGDDVLKQLQAKVAELKAGKPSDADKELIKVLGQAIDALNKAQTAGKGGADLQRLRTYYIKVDKAGQADASAAEIRLLNSRLDELKGKLKSTLKEYSEIQAKIREHGGNSGDTPTITWKKTAANTKDEIHSSNLNVTRPVRVQRVYTVTRPVTVTKQGKTEVVERPVTVKEPIKPGVIVSDGRDIPSTRTRAVVRVEAKPAGDAIKSDIKFSSPSDRQRIEALEKKLKDLQSEVESFRKGQR